MSETTDDYKIGISRLKDRDAIRAISAHVKTEYNGDIYIIFKKRHEQEEAKIQFLVETAQSLDAFQLSDIASFIQDHIKYEGEISVRPKTWISPGYAAEMEKRILLFHESNFERLQEGLSDEKESSATSPRMSYFFEKGTTRVEHISGNSSNMALEMALKYMELAVRDNPGNLQKIVEKAKELSSPTSKHEN